jgi:hypothetical protein
LDNNFVIRFTGQIYTSGLTTAATCYVRGPNNNLSLMSGSLQSEHGGRRAGRNVTGALIDSHGTWQKHSAAMLLTYLTSSASVDPMIGSDVWAGPVGSTFFMGMRFGVGGGDYHYGWVEVTRSNFLGFADLTLNSWYVNGTVNEGVVAGQQGSNAVPGLGGLAALACGAAGVRRRRNRVA